MTFLELLTGIIKFLPEVRKLLSVLICSPAEKAQEITKLISEEADNLKANGRPKWDE